MSDEATAFRIIEAADTPMSIGPGDLALTIAWPDGSETVEHVSEQAAAALGYRRPDEPPSPPAWMVEVAREANAAGYDAANAATAAAAARAGERDHDLGAATAIRALRLALERGHVVEREGGSSLSLIAMKGPMHRAWRAGFRSARSEARALLDSIQLDDKAEANCTRHVNDILRTLPTRGA